MDRGRPWEPYWRSEFPKRSQGDFLFSSGTGGGPFLFSPPCAQARILLYSFSKTDFLTPDLANYGPDGTQDHLNPVRRTLLYRHFARRAHHLPPDPNILNAKTKKVKA